jgi:antitoxin ParD1/3/4
MARNTSFSLGDHFSEFIERQVESGRFGPASEVLRASLRLLEEEDARLAALRSSLVEGERSGPAAPFDFDAFMARKRDAARR